MSVVVRKAAPGDREAICAVHIASIRGLCSSHYTPEQVADWSGRLKPESYDEVLRTREMVVACEGDLVIGFGQLNPDACEVDAVYVAPERARRGAGARILGALEQAARAAGLTRLHLRATLNAVAFYESQGYERGALVACPLAADLVVPCVEMLKRLAG